VINDGLIAALVVLGRVTGGISSVLLTPSYRPRYGRGIRDLVVPSDDVMSLWRALALDARMVQLDQNLVAQCQPMVQWETSASYAEGSGRNLDSAGLLYT